MSTKYHWVIGSQLNWMKTEIVYSINVTYMDIFEFECLFICWAWIYDIAFLNYKIGPNVIKIIKILDFK